MTSIERSDLGASGWSNDRILVAMAGLTILGSLAAGVVAAESAIIAVALASAALLGMAMVLRPDTATVVTIFILYSNAAVVAVRFHGVPVFVGAAVPLLLVAPLARDLVARRLPVVAPPMLGGMVALLFVHVVSALFSNDLVRTWDAVVVFAVEGVGLYFLLVNTIRTPEVLRQATWALLAAGAFVSVLSVHQVLTDNYANDYLGFAQASDAAFETGETTLTGEVTQPRLAGSIGETNRFAQVMLMLVPLGLFRAVGEPARALRLLAVAMTSVITLGVVFTFSRGGAVGLAALVVALALLRMIRMRYVVLLAIGMVVVLAAFPQYALRISSIAEVGGLAGESGTSGIGGAILSRVTEVLAAVLVMIDHPLIGVGPGMFPLFYEQYASLIGLRVIEGATRESHNLYAGLGAELGIVGLAIFLWIAGKTVSMILEARRRSRRRRPDLEQLTTPFALAIGTYFVTGIFLHLSFARFYWLMLAVAGAAAVITLREMDAMDASEAETGVSAPASSTTAQLPYSQSV